jgi:hypothetical protein
MERAEGTYRPGGGCCFPEWYHQFLTRAADEVSHNPLIIWPAVLEDFWIQKNSFFENLAG